MNTKHTAVMGLVRAVLACVVLFGFDLSTEQMAGLVLVAEAALVAYSSLRPNPEPPLS